MKVLIISQVIAISGVRNGVTLDKEKARSTHSVYSLLFSVLLLNRIRFIKIFFKFFSLDESLISNPDHIITVIVLS